MVVFSPVITSRLKYIAELTLGELGGQSVLLTNEVEVYKAYAGPAVNYSPARIRPAEVWIVPHGSLGEKEICIQSVTTGSWGALPVFFQTGGDIPFDFFSAAFYLISRYEEYLPHQQDMYGRFAHTASLAFRERFLQKPLVNLWLSALTPVFNASFPGFGFTGPSFRFLPTYDIDEAFSYLHKGWVRNAGGFIKDVVSGKSKKVAERLRVLSGSVNDPYDALDLMQELNTRYRLTPVYFFLVAAKNAGVDKNILPDKPVMQSLIKQVSALYTTGLHPSWQSGDRVSLLLQEKQVLEQAAGYPVTKSRQHFIRFNLPQGYRRLMENGITEDFSMGYGSINGFRASVASSFLWYDLEQESTTGLRVFPFCFMDANSFYEQKQTPAATLPEMMHYYREVKQVNGLFSMIWHNTFFGTDTRFAGWRELYESFLHEVCKPDDE